MNSKSSPVGLVRTVWGLRRSMRLFWRLFNDPRVPAIFKAVPLAGFIYLISPLDFDFIPVIGQMDDVAVLLLLARFFVKLCPQQLVQEHEQALGRTGHSAH